MREKLEHPIFIALAEVVSQKDIPKQLLVDLSIAFRMDVTTRHYRDVQRRALLLSAFGESRRRLVLLLFDDASERNCRLSDNICTALQLANFWQDIPWIWRKGGSMCRLKMSPLWLY